MKKWRFCLLILVFFVCLVLPVVAVDGGKIVFTSTRDGNSEIYVVNSDGTGITRLTNNPASDLSPAWSPDRTKIAFTSDRDGNNEIYVMNADGSGQIRIATNSASDLSPDWSPDGSKIVFTSDRDGHQEIYVMNADGTGQTRLTTYTSGGIYFNQFPAWSPDGTKIAFSSRRDPFLSEAIYVMNPDGTQQTRLPSGRAYMPAWSPYGAIVAFVWEEFVWDIYIINADGTGRTALTDYGPNSMILNSFPTWSPDGSKIAFGRGQDIYVMYSDGSGQSLFITNGGDPDWGFTPVEAVKDLSAKVKGLGLSKGIEQSLLAKLNTADKKITQGQNTPARNTLKAFINEINAQRGKALTTAQANELIATAQRIINSIPGK